MLLVHMLCIKITLIINTYYEWSSSSLLGVEFRVPLTGEGLGWALCRAGELESIASGPPCDTVTFNTLHQHTHTHTHTHRAGERQNETTSVTGHETLPG